MLNFLKLSRVWLSDLIDARDIVCAAGLGFIGYGIGQVSPPAAWSIVGLALFWLSVRR